MYKVDANEGPKSVCLIQVSLYQKRVPQKSLKMSEKAHEMNSRVSKIFIVVVLGKLIIFEVNSER